MNHYCPEPFPLCLGSGFEAHVIYPQQWLFQYDGRNRYTLYFKSASKATLLDTSTCLFSPSASTIGCISARLSLTSSKDPAFIPLIIARPKRVAHSISTAM